MKKPLSILIIFILFSVICQQGHTKGIELVLHKDFLQELINHVFPISFSETYTPDLPVEEIRKALSFVYRVTIHKPVLSIHPRYIQVDVTVDWLSSLGEQSFPGMCRFLPVFNPETNRIEFRVIEGKFSLRVNVNDTVLDLGRIDISRYISDVTIPLEFDSISTSGTAIKPQCKNVTFRLLKDRIVISSEIVFS